jgi:hypothetical protein
MTRTPMGEGYVDGAHLYSDEVLATADLIGRVRRSGRRLRVGGVTFGRPRLRPAGEAAASSEPGGDLSLAFDLAPPPRNARYIACYLRVRFDDPRVRVVSARLVGEGSFFGLNSHTFGWFFGHLDGRESIPHAYRVRAVIEIPPDVGELTGMLRTDVSVVTGTYLVRTQHTHTTLTPVFALPVPAHARLDAASVEQDAPGAPQAVTPPGVRLCCAADIERFSRFRNPEAARAQRRFVELLARARRHALIDEADVQAQSSGDGQLTVLPAGLDESTVVPRLIEGLRRALAETNADLSEHARLRIRVALHRGHIASGANGWVGDVPIAVHRLLDSPPVRGALVDHPEADLALIVSDVLYLDVIAHHDDRALPESFVRVDAVLPAKNFSQPAWVHVPAAGR